MKPLSPCQQFILDRLRDMDTHNMTCQSAGRLLVRAGLAKRPAARRCNNCFVGYAVLSALERRGLVCHFLSSHDQWAVKVFALTTKGKS